MTQILAGRTALDRARLALAGAPDEVVETIALEAGVRPLDVLQVLPAEAVRLLPAGAFADLWDALTAWEEVLFIVHTEDIVFEVNGRLPAGSAGHGWFNFHGPSPLGGHISKDRCTAIALVDRPFHGRRSCSVWFMNGEGRAMFKVFVPRDADRALKPGPLAAFEALQRRYGP